MEYPKILFKSGWADLDDNVIVWNPDDEARARRGGMTGINEESTPSQPEQATQEAPKRRGRPPKVPA